MVSLIRAEAASRKDHPGSESWPMDQVNGMSMIGSDVGAGEPPVGSTVSV